MFKQYIKGKLTGLLRAGMIEAAAIKAEAEQAKAAEQEDDLDNPAYYCEFRDLTVRMRLGFPCNIHCKFCYQPAWLSEEEQKLQMPAKWLYEYCRPLYENAKIVCVTGGEITHLKEGFNFCKFLSDEYPAVAVMTESNGLLYGEKWRDLAVTHIYEPIFSVNAACPETYAAAVWPRGGEKAYEKIIANIDALVQRQREENLGVFAPTINMVVNRESCQDVRAFAKLALQWGCRTFSYYFDQREGCHAGTAFAHPEIMNPALREVMKIERLLKGKVFVWFRLWLPMNSTQELQAEVDAMDMERLKLEYADLWEYAKNRDIRREHDERNRIRRERGKRLWSLADDQSAFMYRIKWQNEKGNCKTVCFAPFRELDLHPQGRLDICGWLEEPMLNLQDFIRNSGVNWEAIWNGRAVRQLRKRMLEDDYSNCLACCPLHPQNPHLNNAQPVED